MSHFVIICFEPPPLLVTAQRLKNFELKKRWPMLQILGHIFAEMCMLSTWTLSSTWKATFKIRWSGAIAIFKIILMQLLKQHFRGSEITLWLIPPPPMSHFAIILGGKNLIMMAPHVCGTISGSFFKSYCSIDIYRWGIYNPSSQCY